MRVKIKNKIDISLGAWIKNKFYVFNPNEEKEINGDLSELKDTFIKVNGKVTELKKCFEEIDKEIKVKKSIWRDKK